MTNEITLYSKRPEDIANVAEMKDQLVMASQFGKLINLCPRGRMGGRVVEIDSRQLSRVGDGCDASVRP